MKLTTAFILIAVIALLGIAYFASGNDEIAEIEEVVEVKDTEGIGTATTSASIKVFLTVTEQIMNKDNKPKKLKWVKRFDKEFWQIDISSVEVKDFIAKEISQAEQATNKRCNEECEKRILREVELAEKRGREEALKELQDFADNHLVLRDDHGMLRTFIKRYKLFQLTNKDNE